MKKLFLLIGALAVGIAILFVLKPQQTAPTSPPAVATSSLPVAATSQSPTPAPSGIEPAPAGAFATIRVGEKSYTVSVSPGGTVIDTMRALVSTGDFTYTSREYPGLGTFVDSINGKKGEGGMYWILYINGVSATSGASAAIVSAGDIVEWKYEKGY
ncbi:hypothetical protein A3I46_02675 [Candidatus Kaiserbacteria bacterium RIFCSPLOWO2_02_FULL_54_13]|uniref:Transcobalamin-like C-terminal domain-containing protein n=1 Tax=Candidatus Kaiserbacteria bacterium RIFCSPHIGHO2_02_FULL_54_22 TaxID=1798495 RepID=A0A1F6DLX3_9BACT|nr:MAG: hypothetical protein UY91_C0041G0010 [Parcubacteria group bacterium GW2011_GWB1_55_9]OGG62337.1 MAG: hypothetical protein A3C19_03510 [Candidatus Kaiserbacteria bacterium RIFCSPHIGHO2_02_FULL_54_22]OGG68845.1 MAG: hypothetical protein A3E99_02920 [Candidatus Kaiserbacteria bacterium RIFCSPHIGHO2_12_FULL_54_16]OGG83850.1 MAG: hypothetical protein A3I46_02675 [Candidatus Kaiserbacteria bacterium RIFCSPLOWO2_02_FULL_54_13]OGG90155.1 MAG: hypothetical protein A3G12_03220 [Candidatus Kaiserb